MKHQRGFTLIELMVGVALGLLATVVISQVFLQSEENKRSTTSGNDAAVNGALAMFMIQRDVQTAGYGMLSGLKNGLGCPLTATYNGVKVLDPVARPTTDLLAPVVITKGASASVSDSITIMSSSTTGYSVPMKVTTAHAQSDASFTVASTYGVAVGDLMVAVPPTWGAGNGCTLFRATATLTTTQIPHAVTSPSWNSSTSSDMPTAGYPTAVYPIDSSALINLGPAPNDKMVRRTYSIDTKMTLQSSDLVASSGTAQVRSLFPQVVLIKALYGKATVVGGAVTAYNDTAPTLVEDWQKVQTIRVVLVARSGQYSKDVVTASAPLWEVGPLATATGAATCYTSSKCITLDLSGTGAANEWKHYRYKVYDSVMPLRNVVWNQ